MLYRCEVYAPFLSIMQTTDVFMRHSVFAQLQLSVRLSLSVSLPLCVCVCVCVSVCDYDWADVANAFVLLIFTQTLNTSSNS